MFVFFFLKITFLEFFDVHAHCPSYQQGRTYTILKKGAGSFLKKFCREEISCVGNITDGDAGIEPPESIKKIVFFQEKNSMFIYLKSKTNFKSYDQLMHFGHAKNDLEVLSINYLEISITMITVSY